MPENVIDFSAQQSRRKRDKPLSFEVVSNKPRLTVGDQVIVRGLLCNVSDDDMVVNARLALNGPKRQGEVVLKVVGPNGKSIPFSARVRIGPPDRKEQFATIAPAACVGREYELGTYYKFDRPGKYTITGTYTNKSSGDDLGLDAWTGELQAEPVTLEFARNDRSPRRSP